MPTSHLYQINEIVELILTTKPSSMLDVGVGFGKYGFLAREYLELWDGREKYDDWTHRIDGIEVFKEYLTPVHEYIYSNLFIGNAQDILPTMRDKQYDLILLMDVVEHFDYDEAMSLIREAQRVGRNLLISTPKDIGTQTDSFGNVHETHKFQFTLKQLRELGPSYAVPNVHSLICLVGPDAPRVQREIAALRKAWLHKAHPITAYPERAINKLKKLRSSGK
ncbi:MAG TPA: class I SAM-dependent methyltransferase [Candidatus Saccharimonadia bacterium]|nr:class I SAM-dependent methyltransferase [Candidatus Saccharimonadia bacterium]